MRPVPPIPVHVVVGLDAADMALAAVALQLDLPRSAIMTVHADAAAGEVRWVVADQVGVVERGGEDVAHPCLTCSIREAVLPALVRLADSGRWHALVVVLPVAAEPLPMVAAIADGQVGGHAAAASVATGSVVAVVSASDLCDAVFDDPLLAELGLAMVADDRRAYGEVLVNQLELADDIVLAAGAVDEVDSALLEHLRRPESRVHVGTECFGAGADRAARRHDVAGAREFVDPRHRRSSGAAPAAGIVTVELTSWKPFHPARLLDRLEELGGGDQRGRGAFWLPGRPSVAIAWEASGAALSIGAIGDWSAGERATRLVVTGDEETINQVEAAFDAAIMTDAEVITAQAVWAGRSDGFEQWLGGLASGAA